VEVELAVQVGVHLLMDLVVLEENRLGFLIPVLSVQMVDILQAEEVLVLDLQDQLVALEELVEVEEDIEITLRVQISMALMGLVVVLVEDKRILLFQDPVVLAL
jgi:hypothetical protein